MLESQNPSFKILIVDDELSMRELLCILFEDEGYEVQEAENVSQAKRTIQQWKPDVVLSDLNMPGESGLDLLRWVKEMHPEMVFVVLTAFGSASSAVDAMKLGAANYVLKPFNNDELSLVVSRALGVKTLEQENRRLKKMIGAQKHFDLLIGDAMSMLEVYQIIKRVQNSPVNCLLVGERGTGKELIARAIHFSGNRGQHPFVVVNCGAIPESQLEVELFGAAEGAVPGVFQSKMGRILLANQGTLFLDEVESLPLALQVRLVSAIQQKEIFPVGASQPIPFNTRIISATISDLENQIQEGHFREDLFYGLNLVEIQVPPLRDRLQDVELLIQEFIERYNRDYDKRIIGVAPDVLEHLRSWKYPGNVTELRNIIERAVAISVGNIIHQSDLPTAMLQHDVTEKMPDIDESVLLESGLNLDLLLSDIERKWLLAALRATNGRKNMAADLLKMSFRSFRYRLEKHNLD